MRLPVRISPATKRLKNDYGDG
jgi:hypothetical protein